MLFGKKKTREPKLLRHEKGDPTLLEIEASNERHFTEMKELLKKYKTTQKDEKND